jgi:hemerythrin-like domain-containing protein
MEQAIETLMHEHRVIEQVLGSLETFALNIRREADADRETVKEYGDFFKNFADRRHHGKEEDRLFAKMNAYGFPKEYGPVAVMLAEHVEGRGHVGALVSIGEGAGPLSAEERDAVVEHALAYVPLLRAHIMKEDNILYPMAIQAIPHDEMEAMSADFEAFEANVMGAGEHEKFHALADTLIEAYPPDPARMAEGSACTGCSGHM